MINCNYNKNLLHVLANFHPAKFKKIFLNFSSLLFDSSMQKDDFVLSQYCSTRIATQFAKQVNIQDLKESLTVV